MGKVVVTWPFHLTRQPNFEDSKRFDCVPMDSTRFEEDYQPLLLRMKNQPLNGPQLDWIVIQLGICWIMFGDTLGMHVQSVRL